MQRDEASDFFYFLRLAKDTIPTLIKVVFSVFTALNKAWCVHHFACSMCDQKMTQKSKFYEFDLKPVCKKCYDKFPGELRKRVRKAHDFGKQ